MTKFKAGDIVQRKTAPKPPAQNTVFLICRVHNELQLKYAQYEVYCYNTKKKGTIYAEAIDKQCELIKKATKLERLLYN